MHQIAQLLYSFIPEEDSSVFHTLGYGQLEPGVIQIDTAQLNPPQDGETFVDEFRAILIRLKAEERYSRVRGIILTEEWQENLKRVVLRIIWQHEENGEEYMQERMSFIADYTKREAQL